MADNAPATDDELFGTLRLPRGGKQGYRGVRGGQGKARDRFQAYTTVDSRRVTVPGLFKSAHEAAVALAQWKQQRELGLCEDEREKKPRAKRGSLLVAKPHLRANGTERLPHAPNERLALQQLPICSPAQLTQLSVRLPVTTFAIPLGHAVPA